MKTLNLLPQQVTVDVLSEKYLKGAETTADELFIRVAAGIAKAEKTPELVAVWTDKFLQNLRNGAIGAGRIMAAAGTDIKATLANCFVQPVGDCFQGLDSDGLPGIFDALRQAGETMRRGGGVGYNFSAIRPKGALVKGTLSDASGPCSFMDVFDTACKTVESAGSRRGAQMGIMSIEHPDVMEFVQAKRTKGRWNNFNVSIGVTEAFMIALENGHDWQLVHKAEPNAKLIAGGAYQREDGKWVYKTLQASEMWDVVMRSTYDFAEPGIVFLDTMNKDNNLRYCELIIATNPCGEVPLQAYGCCNLGPVILPRFVQNAFTAEAMFDFNGFVNAVAIQVRFLDNVLDVTHWPLKEQEIEAQNKRRIGVGFTGLGNALSMLGLAYNSKEGLQMAKEISEVMRNAAYEASIELAKERGSFPLLDTEKFLEEGTFASRLPADIKDSIRQFGIRNSHLVSIAPTGTVSLSFADNASNGIEPAYSWAYERKKRLAEGGEVVYAVQDHAFRVFLETVCEPSLRQPLLDAVCAYKDVFEVDGVEYVVKDVLPKSFVSALEMSADDHIAMLEVVQPYTDQAISKTVNIPADYPFEDFKGIYMRAWKAGLKGLATYRPNETLGSVLSVGAPKAEVKVETTQKVVDVDPLKTVFEKRPVGDFNAVNSRMEYITDSGSRSLYVSVSFATVNGVIDGQEIEIERPLEIFIPAGQSDVPQEWISTFARGLSLHARSGFLAKALQDARQVKSDRGRVRFGWYVKEDGSKVPRFHESEVGAIAYQIQQILFKQGFLDVDGNPVPARKLARIVEDSTTAHIADAIEAIKTGSETNKSVHGKECKSCGAHAVIKKDGCEFCTNCGETGSCG
jgi:ribonucleoside-diphosphate reductase alpha chain